MGSERESGWSLLCWGRGEGSQLRTPLGSGGFRGARGLEFRVLPLSEPAGFTDQQNIHGGGATVSLVCFLNKNPPPPPLLGP